MIINMKMSNSMHSFLCMIGEICTEFINFEIPMYLTTNLDITTMNTKVRVQYVVFFFPFFFKFLLLFFLRNIKWTLGRPCGP